MSAIDKLKEEYFNYRFAQDLEKLKTLPLEEREYHTKRGQAIINQFFDNLKTRIEEKDYSLFEGATFHPRNKFSRQFFFLLTGIELPKGSKATANAVARWIGQEKIDQINQERAAKTLALENERKKKIDEARELIAQRIERGEMVSGYELAEACAHLGVYLHPRTIGTLRKRVVGIAADHSRIHGDGLSNAPYKAYSDCQRVMLERKENSQPVDPEIERLFKGGS